MTWQEELRQLDSALAGGELSANEYRKRRDEILAAASSAQPPSAVIGPPTGPQPVVPPEGEEAAEGGDNAEVTQVVSVDTGEADQTQIIDAVAASGGEANGNTTNGDAPAANGDIERTQVVAAAAPAAQQQQPPQQVQPQQPVWATQLPDPNVAPAAYPHPQQMGPAVTPMDAQDLFTSNRSPSGSKKPWLIAVVVLVVLALAGGAVWYFALRDDSTPSTADGDQQQTTSAEEPAPEPVDITKIELPGEAAANGGEMDISRASELKVIAPAEATLLAGAGADAVVYSGASEGDYRFLLYSFKSADAAAAEKLTGEVVDVQKQLGFQDTEVQDVPGAVQVSTVSNPQAAAMRGVYTYGDTTIQLCVLQVPKGDVDELRVQFQRAMTAVTDAAPPAS